MSKTASRFVDFRAVKAAVSIEQVLSHYGLLDRFKRGRDSLSGPCPIHEGTNPTQFRVSISKNCWNCFGDCKCGGNVLDFVARKDGVTALDAANQLVDWFDLDVAALNVNRPEERRDTKKSASEKSVDPVGSEKAVAEAPPDLATATSAKPATKSDLCPNKPLKFELALDPGHPYLAERGLTPETIREFGLGYCAKGVMASRIAIPIRNIDGDLVGYAGRWPGEPPEGRPKYRLPDGFRKASEVYRLSEALREPPDQPLIVVEGFFDVIKLWQVGVRKCVALMGSDLSTNQEALILEHLPATTPLIIMFDEDDAGREGREGALLRFARNRFVRLVSFAKEDSQPESLTAKEVQLLRLV